MKDHGQCQDVDFNPISVSRTHTSTPGSVCISGSWSWAVSCDFDLQLTIRTNWVPKGWEAKYAQDHWCGGRHGRCREPFCCSCTSPQGHCPAFLPFSEHSSEASPSSHLAAADQPPSWTEYPCLFFGSVIQLEKNKITATYAYETPTAGLNSHLIHFSLMECFWFCFCFFYNLTSFVVSEALSGGWLWKQLPFPPPNIGEWCMGRKWP